MPTPEALAFTLLTVVQEGWPDGQRGDGEQAGEGFVSVRNALRAALARLPQMMGTYGPR